VIQQESLQIPCEGIFWVIDNCLVYFADKVNPKDPYDSTDLLHKDTWREIKDEYLVDGKQVSFDYFPRGRVETLVIQDTDGTLDHYEATIYLDKCINNKELISEVIDTFRLYLPNVKVENGGQLFIDGSHYTCNKCRK